MLSFDVHVVVNRDKFHIIGPTGCTSFSKFLQQKMQKHSRQRREFDIQRTVHRDIFL